MPDAIGCFISIKDRHGAIHEDETVKVKWWTLVLMGLFYHLKSLLSIVRFINNRFNSFVAHHLKLNSKSKNIVWFIINDQDALNGKLLYIVHSI